MNSTGKLYGIRRSGVSHGDVFTSSTAVSFILDLIGYTSDRDLSGYRILEPSFGSGEFLLEIQKRLIESAKIFNFNATKIMTQNVYGCEIDNRKYASCINLIRILMPGYEPINLKQEDFLLSSWAITFDYIVGNPPYIRYENIPDIKRSEYKNSFSTFHYRCDLYVLFYEHSLHLLSEGGKHCFICSNRWLKNEYGRKLRYLISTSFNLEYIIDVEQLDVFKEAVLAYPSITMISYRTKYQETKIVKIPRLQDLKIPMTTFSRSGKIRETDNWENLFIRDGSERLSLIEQMGFTVGIGVATGADKLFISPCLKGKIEDELLLPIINARDLTGNILNWRGLYLLNPYKDDSSLIDLDQYPKAKNYLEGIRPALERRHIVKNGRCWYSLIDRVKPNLVSTPKILLPDISGNRVVFVDEGRFYPAHNIYYITGNNRIDLELLAAILMSDFVREQLECISNKMNGGLPRWQSQILKKLHLPDIFNISSELKDTLLDAYHRYSFDKINSIVNEVVNSQINDNKHLRVRKIPKSLFDYDFSDSDVV